MMPSARSCDTCGADNQVQARFCRACGRALQAVAQTIYSSTTGQLLPGIPLKHYHIIKSLGKGGFGAVYLAEDTQLDNRLVALKEMSLAGLNQQEQEDATKAFRQEAMMLAHLYHPNLPSIFDHFEENQRWYLVMSFIEGETLEDYLGKHQDGKLPLHEAIEIGIQLCAVLDYLHNRQPPIIFRDLKPANIMRTSNGHICLIDFGIARHFKPGQAKDTLALGSPGYAAPEQYGKAQTTPRSDMYSLGAILHQLCTGHDPTSSAFRFPPPQSLTPAIPPILATYITQMLDMDEGKRPANVLLVKQALQSSRLNPLPQQNLVSPLPPQPNLSPSTPSEPIGTLLYKGDAGIRRNYSMWEREIEAIEWSSDGTRIAFAYSDQTIRIWSLDNDEQPIFLRPKYYSADQARSLLWSPDGKYIAFVSQSGTLQVWDINDGTQPLIYREFLQEIHINAGIAWSPDSTQIAILLADETVQVISLLDEQTTTYKSRLWGRKKASCHFLAISWSSDGRIVAVSNDGMVHIWSRTGRSQHLSYKERDRSFDLAAWSPDCTSIALVSSSQGKFKIWNIYTNQKTDWRSEPTNHSSFPLVGALSWSPDGQRIAINISTFNTSMSDISYAVQVWNINGRKQPLIYKASSIPSQYPPAWSPDGRHLAFHFTDGSTNSAGFINDDVCIWYPGDDDALIHRDHLYSSSIIVAWSPDGTHLASASTEGIQIWNAADTFLNEKEHRWSFTQLLDGTHVASTFDDKKVHFFDTDGNRPPFIYNCDKIFNLQQKINRNKGLFLNRKIMSSCYNRFATIKAIETLRHEILAQDFGIYNSTISTAMNIEIMVGSPDNMQVASIHEDGTIEVWHIDGCGKPFIYKGHSGTIQSLAWSPDNKHIVSASEAENDAIHVWNVDGTEQPFIYKGHNYNAWGVFVASVVWSPDGRRIASSTGGAPDAPNSISKIVQVWNADGSGQPFIYKGHDDPVILMSWSPDGRRIASVSSDGGVQVWSIG